MELVVVDSWCVEAFTPAVKSVPDILVDDVSRHLGVPILGDASPASTITSSDIAAARHRLTKPSTTSTSTPLARTSRHAETISSWSTGCSARSSRRTSTHTAKQRRVRLARNHLSVAVGHLTTVMFAQPDG